MPARAIVIRRRWWAHLVTLLPTFVTGFLAAVIFPAAWGALPGPGGWWKGPLLALAASAMVLILVTGLNALFTYRVEVDHQGLRIRGNLYTHDLRWDEIVSISKRHNHRIPGYHVEIQVDGSNNPPRHWSNFWLKGYFIHPGMEMGGIKFAAYLSRKKRDYHKRTAERSEGT